MDYEKAYNEMVQRARELHDAGNALTRQQMEIVCPELAESEDERVYRELTEYLNKYVSDSDTRKKRWLSYLEKQKEQKPDIELLQRSWYMEGYRDGNFGNEPKWIVKTGEGGPRYEENPKYGQELVKEQKPTPDWMPKFLDELRSKKNYFDWDEHRDIEGHILAIIDWIAPDYF